MLRVWSRFSPPPTPTTSPARVSSSMADYSGTTASSDAISGPALPQLIDAVERRLLVALGQRRVIEHRVDEVVDRSLEDHHRLPDVQQLRRAFADDVYPENL